MSVVVDDLVVVPGALSDDEVMVRCREVECQRRAVLAEHLGCCGRWSVAGCTWWMGIVIWWGSVGVSSDGRIVTRKRIVIWSGCAVRVRRCSIS